MYRKIVERENVTSTIGPLCFRGQSSLYPCSFLACRTMDCGLCTWVEYGKLPSSLEKEDINDRLGSIRYTIRGIYNTQNE